jgi:hypothetical protein
MASPAAEQRLDGDRVWMGMRSKMAISQAAGHVRGFAATDGGPALAGRRREDERKRYGPVIVADESEGFNPDVNPFPPY